MIFAMDEDDRRVWAFASEDEAAGRCKPVDVEDGYWRFYADDGSPLEARVIRGPEGEESAPRGFVLQRGLQGLWLHERLKEVSAVSGCGLTNWEQLADLMRVNRMRRIPR